MGIIKFFLKNKKKSLLLPFECPSSNKISEQLYEQTFQNLCNFAFWGRRVSHLPHFKKTFLKNPKHSLSPTHWYLSAGIISEKPKKQI